MRTKHDILREIGVIVPTIFDKKSGPRVRAARCGRNVGLADRNHRPDRLLPIARARKRAGAPAPGGTGNHPARRSGRHALRRHRANSRDSHRDGSVTPVPRPRGIAQAPRHGFATALGGRGAARGSLGHGRELRPKTREETMPKPINGSRAIAITEEEGVMRGVLLWLLGIPIPIIILLYVFHVV